MSDLLQQHLTEGLPEDTWKKVIEGFCHSKVFCHLHLVWPMHTACIPYPSALLGESAKELACCGLKSCQFSMHGGLCSNVLLAFALSIIIGADNCHCSTMLHNLCQTWSLSSHLAR